ncbi:uncharacterized protein LOC123546436 [Mercenaria mercenaria]|uniref:uncharacterized protein LOC123546436 n=1 Tax=Mercenaria mercenaria TaxID=6596 RepID=UPI00234F4D44|nr:uncharacterized protein LOC123546436 [Mercenaria mercenaria]
MLRGLYMTFLWCGILAFNEDIFKDGVKGPEVVNHVVDLIGQTCLTDNEMFLRRMADVETKDGTDGQTYRSGYNGGIWNIGQDLFNLTKDNPALYDDYQAIKKNLNIDWSNVTWQDLRKPIYSGLAASLLLLSKNIRTIPESTELQATIWGILRPGNRAFDFFVKSQNAPSECEPEKILDVVVILDFQNLSTLDLVHVESFLQYMLDKLPLKNDNTRVAIVTKKQHPLAGWYLNSARPGFTLSDALKILRYTPGPTTVGDSIKYTRENMFTKANGARDGSARVAVLLTDKVTQFEYAKQEAGKLESDGISLVVIGVKDNTTDSYDRFKYVASKPSCRNTLEVNMLRKINDTIERLVRDVCHAPVLLTAGDFTYPCSKSIVAKLPDTTDSVSIMVSAQSGGVAVYAARKYTDPDQSAYDVHLTSSPNDAHTPVLYVRGTDPVYIKVTGQSTGTTCNGAYTVHVKQGKDVFSGTDGVCMVAGTLRDCNDLDMGLISHDVILLSGQDVPNLCDPNNRSIEYFPHPTDPHKFIMCDQHDQAFVGLCPIEKLPCVQISSGCKYTNPCTSEATLSGKMYHNNPCGNQTDYITCTHFGVAQRSACPPERIWNGDTSFCVFKHVHDSSAIGIPAITGIDNPCIHEHADHVYFPYPGDTSKYILCDIHGNAFANKCRDGHWNQQTKTCTTVSPPNVVG